MSAQGLTKAALLAAALLMAACSGPTSDAPRVKAASGSGPAVEYSGDRSPEADQKAQEACAQQGKRAVPRSAQAGPTGGTVKNYDCIP